MAGLNTTTIKDAVNEFLHAPTEEHRDSLLTAADRYREAWIEAKATGGGAPARPSPVPKEPTTTYERELQVRKDVSGLPVRLALQERTSKRVGATWWTLSWRTNLESSGRNRRFYFSEGEFWTIPAEDALELMLEMRARGGFDEKYNDTRYKTDFVMTVSSDLDEHEKADRMAGMTGKDEDWGKDPFFVIAGDPNGNWQKVLLVNRETGIATFRSITTDPTYRPKKELRSGSGWWLDNSMMDANAQQMRQFLKQLEAVLAT